MKKIKPYNVTTIGNSMTGSTLMAQCIAHKVGELSKELFIINDEEEPEGIKLNDLSYLLSTVPIPLTSIHNSNEQYSSRRERRKSERNNKKRNG